MKATGIVRKLDMLGRPTIPIEIRRKLGLEAGAPVEIYVEQDLIIIRKDMTGDEYKASGIVRKLDQLGRPTIPMEIRRKFGLDSGDPLELFVGEDKVIFKKYNQGCIFCGNAENVTYFKGKPVCTECIDHMKCVSIF